MLSPINLFVMKSKKKHHFFAQIFAQIFPNSVAEIGTTFDIPTWHRFRSEITDVDELKCQSTGNVAVVIFLGNVGLWTRDHDVKRFNN